MSKKTPTLNFKITNSNNFIAFLKKLKLVDKSVPLELEGSNLFAKVRTPDKSVIKYVNVDTNDILEGEFPPNRLKIGVLEISKLIDVFKYFGPEEELNLIVESQPYEGYLIATSLKFSSSSLNIFVKCADISLLAYIDDNIQKSIHSTEGSEVNFEISKESFQKISSLTGIETNNEELLNFDIEENGVTIRGNSFQYQIIKGKASNGFTSPSVYTIYKNQFSYIDQESSEIHFHENRILVKSTESDSMIAIGLVEI
jgi:hypothetical protein